MSKLSEIGHQDKKWKNPDLSVNSLTFLVKTVDPNFDVRESEPDSIPIHK